MNTFFQYYMSVDDALALIRYGHINSAIRILESLRTDLLDEYQDEVDFNDDVDETNYNPFCGQDIFEE